MVELAMSVVPLSQDQPRFHARLHDSIHCFDRS